MVENFGAYLKIEYPKKNSLESNQPQLKKQGIYEVSFGLFLSPFQGKTINNEFFSFLTSKKINSNLSNAMQGIDKPKKIGSIKLIINNEKKQIRSIWVYPQNHVWSEKIRKALEKTGFASKAELRVLMHLKKSFPDFKVRSSSNPEQPRIDQLRKHGREVGKAYSIDEVIEKNRNYVVKEAIGEKRFEMHLKRIEELKKQNQQKQNQKNHQKKRNVVKRKV